MRMNFKVFLIIVCFSALAASISEAASVRDLIRKFENLCSQHSQTVKPTKPLSAFKQSEAKIEALIKKFGGKAQVKLPISATQSQEALSQVHEVTNSILKEYNLSTDTLQYWLSKPKAIIKQEYDGQRFYYKLSDSLYESFDGDDQVESIISSDCVSVEDKSDSGGAYTTKLFFVSVKPSCLNSSLSDDFKLKFIIKALNKGLEEIVNLRTVEKSVIGQIAAGGRGFPKLALTEDFFKLRPDGEDSDIYFSVIHAAKGTPLNRIIRGDKEDARTAFSALGTAIGKVHNKFLKPESILSKAGNLTEVKHILAKDYNAMFDYYKTYTHGDLHWNNVFYDFPSKDVVFIDNETFAKSLASNGSSIIDDLTGVFVLPLAIDSWDIRFACKQEGFCDNIDPALRAFADSYLQEFPASERPYVRLFIQHFLDVANINYTI